MPTPTLPSPSMEEALEELQRIVSQIESGALPLEEGIERYARATQLIQHCRKVLAEAEERLATLNP